MGKNFIVCFIYLERHKNTFRLPWDSWSNKRLDVCQRREAYITAEKLFASYRTMELKELENITKCLPPCTIREYRIIGPTTPLENIGMIHKLKKTCFGHKGE